MSNVSSLKGVRTRYRNTLSGEVTNAKTLLYRAFEERDKQRILPDAKKILKLVNTYIGKLEVHMTKVADCIGDSNSDFVQSVIDEDCGLILEAENCAAELDQFIASAEDEKEDETDIKTERISSTDNLLEMQQEMQKMMMTQMEQQRAFFERQAKREKEKEVCSVKLPKLDLCSFGGNKLNWVAFWDAFECTVHKNKKLSAIEKFNYLLTKLYGEAKKAIEGLALSNDNYEVAIDILKERFGNPQDVVNLHYKELINLPPVSQRIDSLRSFSNSIEKHLRSLEVLEEDINQHVFVSIITSKLPEPVLRQLELDKGSKQEWTVDKLREAIREYVTACEKADRTAQIQKDNTGNKGSFQRTNQQFEQKFKPLNDTIYKNPTPKHGSAEALVVRSKDQERKVYSNKCRYCNERHWSDECQRYRTIEERKRVLRGSCYKCLKEGHLTKDCKTKKLCVHCSQTNVHHRSLCPTKFNIKPTSVHLTEEFSVSEKNSPEQDAVKEDHVLVSSNEMVLMQTAKTNIVNPNNSKSKPVRILLDSGSQRTYITENLAKELDLKAEEEQELKLVTFGSEKAKRVKTKSTQIGITLNDGTQMNVVANIVPTISGTLQRNPMKQQFSPDIEHLIKSVDLADTMPTETESAKLDILVGNDYYLDLVLSQKIEIAPGLYLLSSKLGWILSGRTNDVVDDSDNISMFIMTHGRDILENSVFTSLDDAIPTKPDIEDFWNLESIGVTDKVLTSDDEVAMDNFRKTVQFKDGRYYVTWPWKEELPDLPENRELAYGRLKSCLRKLSGKPELLKKYDAIIEDQLQKGVIEKVDNTTTESLKHYVPHHAVLTPQKTTTKLRVVYDASSKMKPEYKSLNECLFRGPVMLHDLCGLLIRFRLHKVALVSDIEKAFLQIGLQPDQRDVTRFLWLKSCDNVPLVQNNIQEYRFCRIPFGVISSPFLLGATVETHLDSYNSDIADKLKENIYVDNVITGTENDTDAIEFYKTAKNIFRNASMNLREWCSNSEKVNESIPKEDRAEQVETSVLGYTWNRETDTIVVKHPKVCYSSENVTKRSVLKVISSVFDPLGLSSPVMLQGKLLLQKLWSKNLQWDEPIVDMDLQQEVNKVCSNLNSISDFPLERCVCKEFKSDSVVYNLLCFCDASKDAYATAVYLYQESSGKSKTDLLFAKTRLAPIKGMTIPRLELMAVLIGVRCVEFVKQQVGLPIQKVYLWSDSQCVIGWVNSAKKLPVFVKNRVSEIKEHSEVIIGYVSSKENPADIATRGTIARELQSNALWWHGPSWLSQPSDSWSQDQKIERLEDCAMETIDNITNSLTTSGNKVKHIECENKILCAPFNIDCENYSSFTHLIRVTALAVRFVNKLRKRPCECGPLKSAELREAECMWFKYVQQKSFGEVFSGIDKGKATNLERQLGLYKDDHGLLRSKGRLEFSSLSEGARCPILLPKKEKVTQLIIEKVHKQNFHAGVSHTLAQVRHRFWIVHGRATVRSVIQACRICRRHEGGPYKMPHMSPLPKSRVTEAQPFNCTGLDYMGPLYIKTADGAKKVWICLFTCLVSRAVHLEIVLDMSAEQFLLCFRRFVSQRGTPSEIISDNAQQFKAASTAIDRVWKRVLHCDDVQSYVSEKGIKYTFIVELAPWMGGFYERLVGLVKRALRKSIGRKMLSLIYLQTLVKEIEAVLNSRPLVYVADDINANITLTPNHFLSLNPHLGTPEIDNDELDSEFRLRESSQDKLLEIWKKGQKILDNFWQIWKDEYLASLRERMQFSLKAGRIQSPFSPRVGDVVLIKDELPRGCWKMGKVSELTPSRDGQFRSAKVSTASGRTLGRPLKLLYPIECSNTDSAEETTPQKEHYNPVTIPKKPQLRKATEKARQNIKEQVSHT